MSRGGVAGEAIAAGLRDSGLTLAVVERERYLPSKTLLRSGETLSEAERARLLAASRVDWTVDFPKVSKRVPWMARDLDDSRPAAAMEAIGARLFRGEGRLTDLRTVTIGGERLIARRAVVIANGRTAAIPPIPGLALVVHIRIVAELSFDGRPLQLFSVHAGLTPLTSGPTARRRRCPTCHDCAPAGTADIRNRRPGQEFHVGIQEVSATPVSPFTGRAN